MTIDPATFEAKLRLRSELDAFRARGLAIDMTRGKPSPAQLDLANPMLDLPGADPRSADGADARNYGNPQGLPECRALFAPLLGVPPDHVAIGNNSSLAMMYDALAWAIGHGVPGGAKPWGHETNAPAFICPVPGYDRHFAICEALGIRMIPVQLTGRGPAPSEVEYLAADPAVKGMWCVPLHSNPTGETYSDETVRGLARMRTAAPDFRIFWDNAYAVHHWTDRRPSLPSMLAECARFGVPDRPLIFASLSKVTFAGSAVAAIGASAANIEWYLDRAKVRTVGPDKLNQLRHVRFLRDRDGIAGHMERHRAILAPKFDALDADLARHLGGSGLASWRKPEGGYFLTIELAACSAKRVVELAAHGGVRLTPAGSTWPGGIDPFDRTLRIAPSFPSLGEIRAAAEGIALSIRLAAAERTAARADTAARD